MFTTFLKNKRHALKYLQRTGNLKKFGENQ